MKPASSIKYFLLLSILLTGAGLSFGSFAGPVCGNAQVEDGEQCDTGEAATNLCNNNTDPNGGNGPCQFTICGDSIPQSPNGVGFDEDCDDGGASATCSEICETIVATTTTTTTTNIAATTTTAVPVTTTDAPVTTTDAPVTTTGVPVTTTATPVTTTGVPVTTTATPVTTTGAPVTTTTTLAGGGTVVIDGCDTGVESNLLQVAANACEAKYSNKKHGKFVRCVVRATRDLKTAGEISGKDKGKTNRCAARSSIGK